jgi:hypothetical protein
MNVIDWDNSIGDTLVTKLHLNVESLEALNISDPLPEGAYRTPDEKWRANDEGLFPMPDIGWQVRPELTDVPEGGVFLFPPPEPLVGKRDDALA